MINSDNDYTYSPSFVPYGSRLARCWYYRDSSQTEQAFTWHWSCQRHQL